MKKKTIGFSLVLLMVIVMLFASCGTSTTTSTPITSANSTATSTAAAGSVVLTITNGSTIKTYSLADLESLTPLTENGGTILTGLKSYQGVVLTDLLNTVGGITEGKSVTIKGARGYSETLTYDQINNVNFNFYDTSGNLVTPTAKSVFAVIYAVNGAPLPSYLGAIELGILSTQNLFSDSTKWIDNLIEIDIISTTP